MRLCTLVDWSLGGPGLSIVEINNEFLGDFSLVCLLAAPIFHAADRLKPLGRLGRAVWQVVLDEEEGDGEGEDGDAHEKERRVDHAGRRLVEH